jgi:hypothetical protein
MDDRIAHATTAAVTNVTAATAAAATAAVATAAAAAAGSDRRGAAAAKDTATEEFHLAAAAAANAAEDRRSAATAADLDAEDRRLAAAADAAAAEDRRLAAVADDEDRRLAAVADADAAEDRRLAASAAALAAEDRRLAASAAALAAEDRKHAAAAANQWIVALNEMTQDQLEMNAVLQNLVFRSRNRYAFKYFSSHGRNEPLAALCKERAGAGVALPGVRAHRIMTIPLGVGDAVGAPFPATIRDFKALTPRQLSSLAIMLNEDFGITAGDSLRTRRAKFQHFIS